MCSSPSNCSYCYSGYTLSSGICIQYNNTDLLCGRWNPSNISQCVSCKIGWLNNITMSCQSCAQHCIICTSSSQCSFCSYGYGFVGLTCQKCLQQGCFNCDDDVSKCLYCMGPYFVMGPDGSSCLFVNNILNTLSILTPTM